MVFFGLDSGFFVHDKIVIINNNRNPTGKSLLRIICYCGCRLKANDNNKNNTNKIQAKTENNHNQVKGLYIWFICNKNCFNTLTMAIPDQPPLRYNSAAIQLNHNSPGFLGYLVQYGPQPEKKSEGNNCKMKYEQFAMNGPPGYF